MEHNCTTIFKYQILLPDNLASSATLLHAVSKHSLWNNKSKTQNCSAHALKVYRCSSTQSELEVSGQIYTLAISPTGKNPSIHYIGGWVGPRASLDILGKRMEYVLTEALIVSVIYRSLVCCCSSILLNVVTLTDAALQVVMQGESLMSRECVYNRSHNMQ